jgi:hypothetical protein
MWNQLLSLLWYLTCCWSHYVLNHDQKLFEALSMKWIAKFFKSRSHHTCMHLVTILILQRFCWHFMKCWKIQGIIKVLIDWTTTWCDEFNIHSTISNSRTCEPIIISSFELLTYLIEIMWNNLIWLNLSFNISLDAFLKFWNRLEMYSMHLLDQWKV